MFKDDDKITYFFLYSYLMKARSILQLYLKESCVYDILLFSQSRLERELLASAI